MALEGSVRQRGARQYSAEEKVLLCCARTVLSNATAARIRALVGEIIVWRYLVETAVRHGVLPLIYRNLDRICPKSVPQTVLSHLKHEHRATATRNLRLMAELLRVSALLEVYEVQVTSFKGPTLAISAYDDISLREFSDLDLFVRDCDIAKAKEILLADRYEPANALSPRQEKRRLRVQGSYELIDRAGEVAIEIHTAFRPKWAGFHLDPEQLLNRREWISIGGGRIACFPPAEMLLILCAHGATHDWNRLLWICDIAELLRSNPRLNWASILEASERIRNNRTLFLGLLLARNLLDATVPQLVLDAIEDDRGTTATASTVCNWLFDHESRCRLTPGTRSLRGFQFVKLRENLREKIPHIIHLLHRAVTPTDEDRALVACPKGLYVLYFLVRLRRLFLKAFRKTASVRRKGNIG